MNERAPTLAAPRGGDFGAFANAFGGHPASSSVTDPIATRPTFSAGDMVVSTNGGLVTAQRVALPRDMKRILQRLGSLAAAAGDKYVYSIEYKNRRTGQTTYVEGPTVKLALAVVREYGNCQIQTRVMDEGEQWMIYARFTDIETGFTLERPFQQRKAMDTGIRDAARVLDQILQIGVSKAIRNVITNALGDICDFCVEEANKGILDRVEKNPDGARAALLELIAQLDIPLNRVERVYGRKAKAWTARDMAKMFTELRSIADGMAIAEDIFPENLEAEQDQAAADAKAKTSEAKTEPRRSQTPPATEPIPPQQQRVYEPDEERQPAAGATTTPHDEDGVVVETNAGTATQGADVSKPAAEPAAAGGRDPLEIPAHLKRAKDAPKPAAQTESKKAAAPEPKPQTTEAAQGDAFNFDD